MGFGGVIFIILKRNPVHRQNGFRCLERGWFKFPKKNGEYIWTVYGTKTGWCALGGRVAF